MTIRSDKTTLLTAEELFALTGARLPARQIEILSENRVPYFLTAKGRPVTTWEAVNRALCGSPDRDRPMPDDLPKGFNLRAASR